MAELEALARVAKYRPFAAYKDVISKEFAAYLGHEAAADSILQYQVLLIPGLLQTEEYARAVLGKLINARRQKWSV